MTNDAQPYGRADRFAFSGGKLLLFCSTGLIGALAAAPLANQENIVGAILLFAAVALGYVFLGGLAIRMAAWLAQVAFPRTPRRWSSEMRLALGAVWPVVFAFWAVIAVFNRTATALFSTRDA